MPHHTFVHFEQLASFPGGHSQTPHVIPRRAQPDDGNLYIQPRITSFPDTHSVTMGISTLNQHSHVMTYI
ncbi:MAG: hypothetical protein IIX31_05875 [Alistipes sp.]|nr:hypothetical protein [Alistipes sp.]